MGSFLRQPVQQIRQSLYVSREGDGEGVREGERQKKGGGGE